MSQEIQSQMWLEVAELKQLLDNASKLSMDLWPIIEESVKIAEFTSCTIQLNEDQQITISSNTTAIDL